MVDGFSLASRRKDVRDYWIKAGIGARAISTEIGRQLGTVCVNNIWIPDGLKDIPANRLLYREYLKDSLDQIFALRQDRQYVVDVLEGKLFGIGVESFTVGSHEFYLAYAAKNHVGVCMDTGHYHPTESVVDKLSSVALLVDDLMLHISRGIRWDSDHVLIQCDDLTSLMQEMKRGGFFGKIAMGLDYFDAMHQPGGRLGDRPAGRREGDADRPAGAQSPARAGRGGRRLHHPSRAHGGVQKSADQRRVERAVPADGRAREHRVADVAEAV